MADQPRASRPRTPKPAEEKTTVEKQDGSTAEVEIPNPGNVAGPQSIPGNMMLLPAEQCSIYVLMGRILAELPAIGKNSVNQQQGFNFRGIDDVLNALNPLLAKYGVFYVPRVLERLPMLRTTKSGGVMYEVNLHVQYTFYGPLGDSVVASAWGEGTDSGDKSTSKAMTGAMKQALFQAFAVSTQETSRDDSDNTTPEDTVTPDQLAVEAGFESRQHQLDQHDQVRDAVRKMINDGMLTDEQTKELKAQYTPSWPMTYAQLQTYAERVTEMGVATKEAKAAAEQADVDARYQEPDTTPAP